MKKFKTLIHYELVCNHDSGYIFKSIQFGTFEEANKVRRSNTDYWFCHIVEVKTTYEVMPDYKPFKNKISNGKAKH